MFERKLLEEMQDFVDFPLQQIDLGAGQFWRPVAGNADAQGQPGFRRLRFVHHSPFGDADPRARMVFNVSLTMTRSYSFSDSERFS